MPFLPDWLMGQQQQQQTFGGLLGGAPIQGQQSTDTLLGGPQAPQQAPQTNMFGGMGPSQMAMLGFGMGMLSPDSRGNGWGNALQGFQSGAQMDQQQWALRKKLQDEAARRAAFQAYAQNPNEATLAAALGGSDPTAALAAIKMGQPHFATVDENVVAVDPFGRKPGRIAYEGPGKWARVTEKDANDNPIDVLVNSKTGEMKFPDGRPYRSSSSQSPTLGQPLPPASPAPSPAFNDRFGSWAQAGQSPTLGQPLQPQSQGVVPSPVRPPNVNIHEWEKHAAQKRYDTAAAMPKDEEHFQSINQAADAGIDLAKRIRDDPNLGWATGPIMGRIPSGSESSINIDADIETLKNKIGINALQAMREASKTGGAVGNASDKDIDLLKNSFAALSQAQGTPQFKERLNSVIDTFNGIKQRTAGAFQQTYGRAPQRTNQGPIDEARNAIAQGVPRSVVIQKLRENNIDPSGL